MSKKDEEQVLEVGDLVKVNVMKYKGFRGNVVAIENGMAQVNVPTYYGNHEPIIVYQDVRYLKPLNKKKKH